MESEIADAHLVLTIAVCPIEVKMSKSKYRKSTAVVIERKYIDFLTSIELNETKPSKTKLSKTGQNVFLIFLTKRQMAHVGRKGKEKWVIVNNGKIVFPYCEAKNKYGIPATTFARAIDQLIKFGLIDINHHGGGMAKDMTTYYISDRWRDYGTPEFKKQFRPKDTRGLGLTRENWEEITGKKRKASLKTSNKNVTTNRGITHAPSNKNVTEEIDPNFFIYKGEEVFRHFQLRSNKNITIL